MSGQIWKVVGGEDKGGILVRPSLAASGSGGTAYLPERLSTGATVKELVVHGDRLNYEKVSGTGPQTGWVTTKLKDKHLLVLLNPAAQKATVDQTDDSSHSQKGGERDETESPHRNGRQISENETPEAFFSDLFDEDDRDTDIARLGEIKLPAKLEELLRVQAAAPSVWLPWVASVRGLEIGRFPSHSNCLLWLAKKARLGQDAFLIASPGANCRLLAMQFCAMAEKEVTYLSLSRDTTESDLKQRREIFGGNVCFTNQPPVDAALNGRVLILEGIEKAERNVLPLLNNLLENREMQLEDGSFLLAPHKQHLLKEAEKAGDKHIVSNLRPVSPNFFVIAIGLPVPRYRGMPLDPPLRSRFAAFSVDPPSQEEEVECLQGIAPGVPNSEIRMIVEVTQKLRKGPAKQAGDAPKLPHPSEEGLRSVAKLRDLFPRLPANVAFHHAFPHQSIYLDEERRKGLEAALGPALSGKNSTRGPGYTHVSVAELLDPGPTFVNDGPFREWEVPPRGVALLTFTPAAADGGSQDGLESLSVRDLREQARKLGINVNTLPPEKSDIVKAIRAAGGRKTLSGQADNRETKGIAAVCGGAAALGDAEAFKGLVGSQHDTLIALLQDHSVGVDSCLIAERGVGKTLLTRRFAQILGYQRYTTFCFQDMTSRELTARRSTDPSGDTIWQWSPLVEAAMAGELAVLDGVHRLPPGTLGATLARLVNDREIDLPDGTRLVNWDHWQALRLHYSADDLHGRKIRLVHPSFRILCTAEPPTMSRNWLDEELMGLLHFVQVELPSEQETAQLLSKAGKAPPPTSHINGLHNLASSLRSQAEREPQLFRPVTFSTRRMLQIGVYAGWQNDLGEAVAMALHAPARFLPLAAQETLRGLFNTAEKKGLPAVPIATASGAVSGKRKEAKPGEVLQTLELEAIALHLNLDGKTAAMYTGRTAGYGKAWDTGSMQKRMEDTKESVNKNQEAGRRQHREELHRAAVAAVDEATADGSRRNMLKMKSDSNEVRIGGLSVPVETPTRPELVPKDHFVDIPKHIEVLQRLLLDYKLGNHMLLIGNQGVGKNKIADRLLALLGKEREYVQLHRDTTVSSLVMTPTLKGGAVVWEDSPLVRAVRHGRVLMVDEADKAPLEVVCVLKSLVEDCELSLPNGKRIAEEGLPGAIDDERVIRMHPGFRVIVLANRPGFPFLGNDFYRECGDVFASIVVDNPDLRSEAELLRSYGPQVPKDKLAKILTLFATLREQVESGKISYPYSAREAVKIVEHLNRYPKDSLERACRDVFAFDLQNPASMPILLDAARGNGIEIVGVDDGASEDDIYAVLKKKEGQKKPQVKTAKTPDGDWRPKERAKHAFSQEELDDAIRQLEDYGANGEELPDRKRGLPEEDKKRGQEATPAGAPNPIGNQAKQWGLPIVMHGGHSGADTVGIGIDKPNLATSGFGIAMGGPMEGAPIESQLPPSLRHLKFPDKVNFRKHVLDHIRKELELAYEEGYFASAHLLDDEGISADSSLLQADMAGAGDGKGGKGEGKGEGTGKGAAKGKGSGKGEGEGEGSGEGEGKGQGSGKGEGEGKGSGKGEGEGKGSEKGEGEGKGSGKGEGEGEGKGSGKGDGEGEGEGEGEGKGKGSGKGEGEGKGSGKGEGEGKGSGKGEGKGKEDGKGDGQGKGKNGAGKGKGKGKGPGEDEGYDVPLEPGMTRAENNVYEKYLDKVERCLSQMRRLLEGHVAKEREREWQTFLTDGELDDGLVVDGVCGQQNVYRRRATAADPMFIVKQPKRLMFAVDLSMSMKVYNNLDYRLDRLCEATVFIMEAFSGYEEKYEYAFVGFSGDGPAAVNLVEFGKPPKARRQRMEVINTMRHHASTVKTGDSTIEATKHAIKTVISKPADEHFAFIVSDAEVDRYGITPEAWNDVLMKTERKVLAYAILISMESQKVENYRTGFEPGHGFLCESSDDMVGIFQKIFDTALFK